MFQIRKKTKLMKFNSKIITLNLQYFLYNNKIKKVFQVRSSVQVMSEITILERIIL